MICLKLKVKVGFPGKTGSEGEKQLAIEESKQKKEPKQNFSANRLPACSSHPRWAGDTGGKGTDGGRGVECEIRLAKKKKKFTGKFSLSYNEEIILSTSFKE